MALVEARPFKLRSGSWGVNILGTEVAQGDVVLVKSRGGKVWEAEVVQVIWEGDSQVDQCRVTVAASVNLPPRQTSQGVCSCGHLGILYGWGLPGRCLKCVQETR